MQLSNLYKNRNNKLYFTDYQYQKGGFKCQDLSYYKKKRMKEIKIIRYDKARDKRNIIIS